MAREKKSLPPNRRKGRYDSGKHAQPKLKRGDRYDWSGREYVAVTAALGIMEKSGLTHWAANLVARHVYTLCILKENDRLTGAALMSMLKDVQTLSKVPWQYKEVRRNLGSAAHKIAEQVSIGQDVDVEALGSDLKPYVKSLVEWFDANRPVVLASEMTVANHSHGYAGTLDMVVDLNGERLVIDFKTSKDTHKEHALQLAAYRFAEKCLFTFEDMSIDDDDLLSMEGTKTSQGYELPMIEDITGGAILLVQPHECRLMRWECGEDEFEAFLHAKGLYSWTRRLPKPWEGSPHPTLLQLLEQSVLAIVDGGDGGSGTG